jgi:hypothetical protein
LSKYTLQVYNTDLHSIQIQSKILLKFYLKVI